MARAGHDPERRRTHAQAPRRRGRRRGRRDCGRPADQSAAASARRHGPPPYAPAHGAHDGEPSRGLAAEAGDVRPAAASRPERRDHRHASGAERAAAEAAADGGLNATTQGSPAATARAEWRRPLSTTRRASALISGMVARRDDRGAPRADGRMIALWFGQAILGWLIADAFSGVFHWWQDRIGDERMPIIGPEVVVPNRLHHVDPLAFTRSTLLSRNLPLWIATALISATWLTVTGPDLM